MGAHEFITGHLINNPAYTYKFQLKTTQVGNGWQFAEKNHPEWGKLAVCVNQEEWQDFCVEPPCGQVSPFFKIESRLL